MPSCPGARNNERELSSRHFVARNVRRSPGCDWPASVRCGTCSPAAVLLTEYIVQHCAARQTTRNLLVEKVGARNTAVPQGWEGRVGLLISRTGGPWTVEYGLLSQGTVLFTSTSVQ